MNTRRGLCFLLVFTNSVKATLNPRAIPKVIHETYNGVHGGSPLVRSPSYEHFNPNLNHPNGNPSESIKAPEFMPARPVENTLDCPPHMRRSLILVRRGCIGGIGKGLASTAAGLSKSASRLQRFDRFFSTLNFRQKLAWFGKKGYNGAKHTIMFGVSGVAFLGKMLRHGAIKTGQGVGRAARATWHVTKPLLAFAAKVVGHAISGILLMGWAIMKGTWRAAKFVGYKIPIHSWKYLGKGLAATGRGLLKVGTRMEAQSISQLSKKKLPTQ